MTEELKLCPCCGGSAAFDQKVTAGWAVFCPLCRVTQWRVCSSRDDAIVAWNTRPSEDALAAEVERLRALVSDGLDLCVKGRVMDQHDGNLPLWIVDGYTAELTAWEAKARAALAQPAKEAKG